MARDISATIKINDGFSNPLANFASRIGNATSKLGELGQKLTNIGNIKPPTPAFDRFNSSIERTNGLFGKMVGANVVGNAISSGIGMATNSVSSLIGELNQGSAAWQTFNGNMRMIGMSSGQIKNVQNDLQDFAAKSIYSSSDMAQTYSQFAAVGVKNADQLVKGFGGLAAAAINPQQAMQTLSQQSVQAASRPMVQWQDFKLMMEQTPAGMEQVARSMGTTLGGLSNRVHDGTLKTQDLFNAISKVGTNKAFSKMATNYKTVGEAAQGLKETMTNKLQKSFDKVSQIGINALKGLANSFDNINFAGIERKIIPVVKNIVSGVQSMAKFAKRAFSNFWQGLSDSGAIGAVSSAIGSISGAVGNMFNSLKSGGNNPFGLFKTIGDLAGGAISFAAKTIGSLANVISKMNPSTLKMLVGAFLALKFGMKGLVFTGVVAGLKLLSQLSPGQFNFLAKSLIFLAGSFLVLKAAAKGLAALNAIKGVLGGIGKTKAPTAPQAPKQPQLPQTTQPQAPAAGLAKKWLQLGAVFVMVGAGALMLGAGLYLMASAATSLASAGGGAIAVFFGFFAAIGALLVLVRALGPALIVGAAGFVVFAAAMLIIGVSIFIAAAGITLLATQLPVIAQYGLMASVAIVALGAAIAIFGALAIVGSIGLIALSVGLIIAGVALTVAAIGAGIFGIALFVVAAGIGAVALACIGLGVGLMVVAAGFNMLAGVVGNAINNVVNAVRNGFNSAKNIASSGINAVVSTVSNAGHALWNAGVAFMDGLLNGIKSGFEKVKGFVGGIANWIKAHKGPVTYDAKLLIPAGNAIMNGLNAGITNGFGAVQDNIKGVTEKISNTKMSLPALTGDFSKLDQLKGQTIDTSILNNLPQLQIAGLNNLPQLQVADMPQATFNNAAANQFAGPTKLPQLQVAEMPQSSFINAAPAQTINTVATMEPFNNPVLDTSGLNNLKAMQYAGPQTLPLDASNLSLPQIQSPKIDTSGLNNLKAMQYAGPQTLPLDASNLSFPQIQSPKLDTNGFNNVITAKFGAVPQFPQLQVETPNQPLEVNQDVPTSNPFTGERSSNFYNNKQTSSNINYYTTNNYQNDATIEVKGSDNPEMTAEQVVSKFETFFKSKSNGGLGYGYKS